MAVRPAKRKLKIAEIPVHEPAHIRGERILQIWRRHYKWVPVALLVTLPFLLFVLHIQNARLPNDDGANFAETAIQIARLRFRFSQTNSSFRWN